MSESIDKPASREIPPRIITPDDNLWIVLTTDLILAGLKLAETPDQRTGEYISCPADPYLPITRKALVKLRSITPSIDIEGTIKYLHSIRIHCDCAVFYCAYGHHQVELSDKSRVPYDTPGNQDAVPREEGDDHP